MRVLREAAVWLLPALATALVLPNKDVSKGVLLSTSGSPSTGTALLLDYQPENGFVKFNIPCSGCSKGERKATEEAAFAFSALETQKARCSDESGILFPGERERGYGPRGQGSFKLEIEEHSQLDGARGQWSISCVCLNEEAGRPCLPQNSVRVLVFSLRSIGQYPHPGFTITYRDFDKPEILKFSLFPDDEALLDLTKSIHWHNPTVAANPSIPFLDDRLYHSTLLNQPFLSPTGSNPSNSISTGTVLISSATVTISTTQPTTTQAQVDRDVVRFGSVTSVPEPTVVPITSVDSQADQPPKITEHVLKFIEAKTGEFVHAAKNAHPNFNPQNPFSSIITSNLRKLEDARTISHEIVVAAGKIPSLISAVDSTAHAHNSDIAIEPKPSAVTSDATTSPSKPPSRSKLRTDQAIRAFQITSVIAIVIALSTSIFVYLFRNPRRRADRAARAEERRRRRLYRQAARQHKWRSWLGRVRGTFVPRQLEPTAETWEEKQVMAGETVPSLGEMRRELRALRMAHTIVDGLVRAEEGTTDGNSFRSNTRRGSRRYRSYSGSTADSVGPPAYDESVTMVNGALYTPNGTDSTPDSSVIDTSPRTSVYLSNSDSEKD